LQDGNKFYGWEIPQNENLLQIICEQCEGFYNKVQKGLDIVMNTKSVSKREQFLHKIEPDPDDTDAYERFMSEAHQKKKKFKKIVGSKNINESARNYARVNAEIKEKQKELQTYKNEIWQILNHESANVIELEDGGKITYNKRLYVNIGSK